MKSLLSLLLLFLLVICEAWANAKDVVKEDQRSSQRGLDSSDVIFRLFSLNDAEETCEIRPSEAETFKKCNFNSSLPVVMLVHGWSLDRMLEKWMWKLGTALLSKRADVNVIITDWIPLAHQHYAVAVRNTRIVGKQIADFIQWLEGEFHFSREKVHLIGYSLGAHASGFAGTYIKGSNKIGRITGLDPAGPLFEGISSADRLSPNDAHFVDAIHTFTQQHMGLSVGIKQPVAHFDFYPNGGNFQPGCHFQNIYNHIAKHGIAGFTEAVKCAHERSVHLFIDSILNEDKQSVAYWCKDINTFDKGVCLSCRKGRCNTLGYDIKKVTPQKGKKLFLKTRSQMPFKVYHYQFKIHFIKQIAQKQLEPTLTVSLIGTKEDVQNLRIILDERITGNKTHSFLITTDKDIGELLMINFKWEGTAVWANIWHTVQTIIPWTKATIHPELIVKKIRVKAGETQERMTFCSQDVSDVHLHPTQVKTFVRCQNKGEKNNFGHTSSLKWTKP